MERRSGLLEEVEHVREDEQVPDMSELRASIQKWEQTMCQAAQDHQFEKAAEARDVLRRLQRLEVQYLDDIAD